MWGWQPETKVKRTICYLLSTRPRDEGYPLFSSVEEVGAPVNLRFGGSKSLTGAHLPGILNTDQTSKNAS
jgi:hypothetical protein